MKVNRDILNSQVEKYNEQIQRLAYSDELVRHLIVENETLVTALQTLEGSLGSSDADKECLVFIRDMLQKRSPSPSDSHQDK